MKQKLLMSLIIVQMIVLVVFTFATIQLVKSVEKMNASMAELPVAQEDRNVAEVVTNSDVQTEPLTQQDIRVIFREELQSLNPSLRSESNQDQNGSNSQPEDLQTNTIANTMSLQSVISQIGTLSSSGDVSKSELAQLETNIARLPPEQRKKALAELNRAVNSGRLNIRF